MDKQYRRIVPIKQYCIRAGGNGLAALVLAGPVFLKVKMKFQFYK